MAKSAAGPNPHAYGAFVTPPADFRFAGWTDPKDKQRLVIANSSPRVKMRHFFILAILILASFTIHAEEVSGSLTLENEFVLFRGTSVETKYELLNIPGMKALEFRRKTATSGDQTINISELVLLTSNGEKVTLVMNKPEAISRITQGKSVRWRLAK